MKETIDGVTYELKIGKGCDGCVAIPVLSKLCNKLNRDCVGILHSYWIKVKTADNSFFPTGESKEAITKPKRKRGYVC